MLLKIKIKFHLAQKLQSVLKSSKKMKNFTSKLFLLFSLISTLIEAKYEIILDRFELPFGENDQIISVPTFRVKKFNRTT